MSNFVVTDGWGGQLIITDGWGFGGKNSSPIPDDMITDHLSRALSLFIQQFRDVRIVSNAMGYAPINYNSDPSQGGIEVSTEAPITNHVERALTLFITQFRGRRIVNG